MILIISDKNVLTNYGVGRHLLLAGQISKIKIFEGGSFSYNVTLFLLYKQLISKQKILCDFFPLYYSFQQNQC